MTGYEYLEKASTQAERFCKEQGTNLSVMTIRKAFELGWRFGYTEGKGEDNIEREESIRHQVKLATRQSPDRDF
jgi:hypothetical protein